jgi:methionyl-tRNA formyltransferase
MIKFKISILSDLNSWINSYVPQLVNSLQAEHHQVYWVHQSDLIPEGDFVFYLGCGQIVPLEILQKNKHNLVVHESALPLGKGWSPLTWQILEGKNDIPIILFEANKLVDSGVIYLQDILHFNGLELVDELRQLQAQKSIDMCLTFVSQYPGIISHGRSQQGEATFYRRRMPKDSLLDPSKSIKEQFNLLRVVDNERYPAFFEINNEIYILKIEKRVL